MPFQTNGKNRLKAAEELLAFAHETMDEVGIEFDKENDKKLDTDIAVREEVVDDMEL